MIWNSECRFLLQFSNHNIKINNSVFSNKIYTKILSLKIPIQLMTQIKKRWKNSHCSTAGDAGWMLECIQQISHEKLLQTFETINFGPTGRSAIKFKW